MRPSRQAWWIGRGWTYRGFNYSELTPVLMTVMMSIALRRFPKVKGKRGRREQIANVVFLRKNRRQQEATVQIIC